MMTDTLVGVNPPSPLPEEPAEPQRELSAEEIAVVEGLVRQAREEGEHLSGAADRVYQVLFDDPMSVVLYHFDVADRSLAHSAHLASRRLSELASGSLGSDTARSTRGLQ